ncbi:hypothetical protein ACJ72_07957, partial [Emergomyces africanus]
MSWMSNEFVSQLSKCQLQGKGNAGHRCKAERREEAAADQPSRRRNEDVEGQ